MRCSFEKPSISSCEWGVAALEAVLAILSELVERQNLKSMHYYVHS